jgi:hypothetical protein
MSEQTSNENVTLGAEPTSYVVEGVSYRELIAQRDLMCAEIQRLRNHLRQKSEQISRLQDGVERLQQGTAERALAEIASLRHDLERALVNHGADLNAPPTDEAAAFEHWWEHQRRVSCESAYRGESIDKHPHWDTGFYRARREAWMARARIGAGAPPDGAPSMPMPDDSDPFQLAAFESWAYDELERSVTSTDREAFCAGWDALARACPSDDSSKAGA